MTKKQIIILAAGRGSRMRSDLPKVMHKVGGKPMLETIIDSAYAITNDIVLVYSEHIAKYLSIFADKCKFAKQEKQLGTAHAVWVAKNLINNDMQSAVIYGDNPLITPEIISELFDQLTETKAAISSLVFEDEGPNEYGRIVIDKAGNFKKIVEFKLATEQEKQIRLCNSGIMVFAPGILDKYLEDCISDTNNPSSKELYLTKIIEICSKAGEKVTYYTSKNPELVMGVNTQQELETANKIIVHQQS